jgi:hypothetical protein
LQEYKKREKEEYTLNVSNAKAWAVESKADPKATKQIMKEAQTTDGAKAKVQQRREDKQEAQVLRVGWFETAVPGRFQEGSRKVPGRLLK